MQSKSLLRCQPRKCLSQCRWQNKLRQVGRLTCSKTLLTCIKHCNGLCRKTRDSWKGKPVEGGIEPTGVPGTVTPRLFSAFFPRFCVRFPAAPASLWGTADLPSEAPQYSAAQGSCHMQRQRTQRECRLLLCQKRTTFSERDALQACISTIYKGSEFHGGYPMC